MNWVLIMVLYGQVYGGVVLETTVVEGFTSEKSCQVAGQEFDRLVKRSYVRKGDEVFICVNKSYE